MTPSLQLSINALVSLSTHQGVPRKKARNGRWVDGNHEELLFVLRVALPGNVLFTPLGNGADIVRFSRLAGHTGKLGWSVRNEQAAAFQLYAASLGAPVVELVRQALESHGVLGLFRTAVEQHPR